MTRKLIFCASLIVAAASVRSSELSTFNTDWITGKPEVLTYRSTSKQGDGLYQVSLWRNEGKIEIYMNIITPGFTKSVWGTMSADFRPQESRSRIIMKNQITMTTDCSYNSSGSLHIATKMAPYKKVMENTIASADFVLDFSQIPLLARVLPLEPGAEFLFSSLNPQNNSLVPLRIRVSGEETIQNTKCFKVETTDFEGEAACWVEQGGQHRVIRIEQPGPGRTTKLIL